MKAFLMSLLAVAVVSLVALYTLEELGWTSQSVYSSQSVRLD